MSIIFKRVLTILLQNNLWYINIKMLLFPWIISYLWDQRLHPGLPQPWESAETSVLGKFRATLYGRTLTFPRNLIPVSWALHARAVETCTKNKVWSKTLSPLMNVRVSETNLQEPAPKSTRRRDTYGKGQAGNLLCLEAQISSYATAFRGGKKFSHLLDIFGILISSLLLPSPPSLTVLISMR